MVAEPEATPVTTPAELIDAIELSLLLHMPPDTVSERVTVAPGQTDAGPDIEPALGAVITVIDTVTLVAPHALITE
jgi:hypothetical protein